MTQVDPVVTVYLVIAVSFTVLYCIVRVDFFAKTVLFQHYNLVEVFFPLKSVFSNALMMVICLLSREGDQFAGC